MAFNKTEEQKREYLQRIINLLQNIISNTDTSIKEHVDTLREYKDYLWSNKDIDPHEIRSMRESILNYFAIGENVIDKRKRLSKVLANPYFGRIDFKENEEDSRIIPIYI
jgi:DNA helicase-2/ATP-dependent DNA helicase PcrA